MPEKKLLAIVTICLMMGSPAMAQQSLSIAQLRQLESLIVAKDCGALYSYLRSNPTLIAGGDPLAAELRSFARDVERGRLDCYVAERTTRFAATPLAARGRGRAIRATPAVPGGRGNRATPAIPATPSGDIY